MESTIFITMAFFCGSWMVTGSYRDVADAAYYVEDRTDIPASEIIEAIDKDKYFFTNRGLYGTKYQIVTSELK